VHNIKLYNTALLLHTDHATACKTGASNWIRTNETTVSRRGAGGLGRARKRKDSDDEYNEDDNAVYKYDDFGFIGFDLWQVKGGTIFDNVIICDDKADADAFAAKWKALSEHEKEEKKKADESKKDDDKKKEDEKDDDDDDDAEDKKEEEEV